MSEKCLCSIAAKAFCKEAFTLSMQSISSAASAAIDCFSCHNLRIANKSNF